jgi:hypothetical protein
MKIKTFSAIFFSFYSRSFPSPKKDPPLPLKDKPVNLMKMQRRRRLGGLNCVTFTNGGIAETLN